MKNKIYYIFIFLFLLVITAPFWGILLKNGANNTENRNLTKISNVKGIYSLNQYITDNHGFRNNLSNLCINFYINILNESPIPDQVELGYNDFLFLGNSYNNTYNSSLGITKHTDDDIRWTYNNILAMQDFFDSLDIDFYLVIAPNKESIYPENMRLKPNNQSRFKADLINKLEQTNIDFLDLTDLLKKNKNQAVLYYKHDSHWNEYGALLATKEVVDHISKKHNLKSINESDYYINKKSELLEYDLAKMINISEPDNHYYDVRLKKEIVIEEEKHLHRMMLAENKSNKNGIKSFVIRDSFFTAMFTPYMSSIESACIFTKFKYEDIELEIARAGKPDFVLYEVVERHINLVGMQ